MRALQASKFLSQFFVIVCLMSFTACGFQLRGTANLSFSKLNLQGGKLTIQRELLQSLKNNNITVVNKAEDADVVLELINEANEKRIQSLSGTGTVREFELYYTVNFRTREAQSQNWHKMQTVKLRRDYSYNDQLLLGKSEEEARLNTDMRSDAVREIVRRLSAVKIAPKTGE